MNKLISALAVLIAFTSSAFAEDTNFDGLYGGLSYGSANVNGQYEQVRTLLLPDDTVEVKTEVVTGTMSYDPVSFFIGYGFQFDSAVIRAEISTGSHLRTAELQAGTLISSVMVYGFFGAAEYLDTYGSVYGTGFDFPFDYGYAIGVRYELTSFDAIETETQNIQIRATYRF